MHYLMRSVSNWIKFLFVIILWILWFTPKRITVVQEVVDLPLPVSDSLTFEKFEAYVYFLELDHPDVVIAQALEESGLKSRLCLEDNNIFGMMHPRKRETLSIGSQWGKYNTWRESVLDYQIYQKLYLEGLSRDEYINRLGKIYCTDPGYCERIKKLADEYKNKQQTESWNY